MDGVRYYFRRYLDLSFFLPAGINPSLGSLAIASFVLILGLATWFAIDRWGKTSTLDASVAPLGAGTNLSDLWFAPNGDLLGARFEGWKVTILRWPSGVPGPAAEEVIDLQESNPLPRPVPAGTRVPNLVGMKLNEAERVLSQAGFKLAVRYVENYKYPQGTVVKQSPVAGRIVPPGEQVMLLVARSALLRPRGGARQFGPAVERVLLDRSRPSIEVSPAEDESHIALALTRQATSEDYIPQPLAQTSARIDGRAPSFAISQDASRLAWAGNGKIYLREKPPGGNAFQVRPLTTDGEVAVAALAFLGDGILVVQQTDDQIIFYDVGQGKQIEKEANRGPCRLGARGQYGVYACGGEERVDVLEAVETSTSLAVNHHHYPVGLTGLTALGVSPSGRPAVAFANGAVLLTGTSGDQSRLSRVVVSPGTVQALTFFDEARIIAAGGFRGIYLLAGDAPSQELVPEPPGKKLLAGRYQTLAYATTEGVKLVSLKPARRLNMTGMLIAAAGLLLVLGLLVTPAGLVLIEEWRSRPVLRSGEVELPPGPELPRLPVPEPPEELVQACADGDCVLYAKGGLSAQAGFPTWQVFVRNLFDWATQRQLIEPPVRESLIGALREGLSDVVADSIASALRGQETLLYEYLRQTFSKPVVRIPPAHRFLQQIPFSAVLTTNFDDLLERTFAERKARVYTRQETESLLEALSRREFFIFKLYGMLDRTDTVVLAPAQFREALSRDRLLSQFTEGLFFSRTIFFVGSSLEGIEAYLSGIALRGVMPHRHYALVSVKGTSWQAKADQLARRYNIQILPYSGGPGYPEIPQFLEVLARAVSAKNAEMGRPTKEIARLKSVTLENIGPFEYVSYEVTPTWNVLLGDNGVGKSTLLKAIAVAICGKDAEAYAGRLIKSGRTDATITLMTDQGKTYVTKLLRKDVGAEIISLPARPLEAEGWLGLGFPPIRSISWERAKEGLPAEGLGRSTTEDLLPLVRGDSDPRLDKLKQRIVDIDYLIKDARSRHPDMAGKTRYEVLRDDLFDVIAKVTPGLTIEFGEVNPKTKQIMVITDDGAVPIESVSQGTASLLGWVGILIQRLYDLYGQDDGSDGGREAGARVGIPPRQQYALVLIDEIDAHMHPAWQQSLAKTLEELFPNVQFVATTHSPLIASAMSADKIQRVFRDPKEGRVVIMRPERDVKGWRVDQVLLDPIFGLETARDPETQDLLMRYTDMAARENLDENEKKELEQMARTLRTRLPTTGERKEAREASEMVRDTFRQRLEAMAPEERKKMVDEVSVQIQEIITGSRRLS